MLVILLIGIAWPLLRYVAFFISNRLAGSLAEVRTRQGALAGPVCRGMLTAMMAEVVAVATYPLGWFMSFGRHGKGRPIVLVHGLFHNASAWIIVLRRLERAGFVNLHTYQYNSLTRNFDTAVAGLSRKLDTILETSPDGRAVLMGHSLGGLVCRKVAGSASYRERVAGLIALGSPHGGSDLARFGTNTMSRSLIPGREVPEAMARTTDADCPKLAIYTLVDDFVFPLNTLLPGKPGWTEKTCSPMGHVWMLYSREITGLVIKFLRSLDD